MEAVKRALLRRSPCRSALSRSMTKAATSRPPLAAAQPAAPAPIQTAGLHPACRLRLALAQISSAMQPIQARDGRTLCSDWLLALLCARSARLQVLFLGAKPEAARGRQAGPRPSLAEGPAAEAGRGLPLAAAHGAAWAQGPCARGGTRRPGNEATRGSLPLGQLLAEIYRVPCLCGIRHRGPEESGLGSSVFSGRQSRPPQSLSGWSPEAADWKTLGRSGTGKAKALPAHWHRYFGYHSIPSQHSSSNQCFS